MAVPAAASAGYTFGSLGGANIIDAKSAIETFQEHGWDASAFFGIANSFRTSLGAAWGSGHVLMARVELGLLSTSEPLTLVLGTANNGESINIEGLYIRSATRITPGCQAHDSAIYLVEIVDSRYLLWRKRVNKRYNCRRLRDTSDGYVTQTTNSGTPWTWEQVLQDLWSQCDSSIIGSYEAQPTVPLAFSLSDLTSKPENLRYEGVSAWEALCDAASRCGCTIVHDSMNVVNFYVMRLGRITGECKQTAFVDQGGSGSLSGTSYSAALTDRQQYTVATSGGCPVFTGTGVFGGDGLFLDEESLVGDVVVPEKIVTWFPTEFGANQINDELTSNYGKWYPVVIDASSGTVLPNDSIAADWYANPNSSAGTTTGRLTRPDFNPNSERFYYELATARFASATATDPTNLTDLTARAKEVARDCFRTLYDYSTAHVGYAGIKFWLGDSNQIIPGKTVSEVQWSDLGEGLRTDIWRYAPRILPTEQVLIPQPGGGSGGAQIVQFSIGSVDCDVGTATGTVTDILCSGAEASIGDTVDLVDPQELLTGDPTLLIGRTGFAVKMQDAESSYGCTYKIMFMGDLGSNCG